MNTDFSVIERLVADFESGAPIDSLLDEINNNADFDEYFADWDFFFVASEDEVFITDDNILDYTIFDKEELINLTDVEILDWVKDRLEQLESEDTIPNISYTCISNSIVFVWGYPMGQAGIHFNGLTVKKNLDELYEMLIKNGYIFLPSDTHFYQPDLLISKYKTFILERLN